MVTFTENITKFVLIFLFISVVSINTVYAESTRLPIETAKLGNVTLSIEIADTPATMEKGLMFHSSLSFNQGMLFVFNPPQTATMWMKDMQYPIDMLWFDGDGNILHVEKSLPPCTGPDSSCEVYDGNSQQTSYVLEVASGFVDHYDISNKTKFVIMSNQQPTSSPHQAIPEFGSATLVLLAFSLILTKAILKVRPVSSH